MLMLEMEFNNGYVVTCFAKVNMHLKPTATCFSDNFGSTSIRVVLIKSLEMFDESVSSCLWKCYFHALCFQYVVRNSFALNQMPRVNVDGYARYILKMTKVSKVRCKADSRQHRVTPHALSSCSRKAVKSCHLKKKHSKTSEKKDWEGATCSICLEHPHNAVLLLCFSYKKGCRPYMCATSRRFSNCLEQYKKAYTKITPTEGAQQESNSMDHSRPALHVEPANERAEVPELLCPLCRGQVKGWTVVEPARKHLNAKKRTCMQDKCSFAGTYKQLRKHVKAKHPLAQPRAVDPLLKEKWKKFECERERNDVISTIMSSTPGALVLGDYVIEPGYRGIHNDYDSDSDSSLDDGFLSLRSFDRGQSSGFRFRNGYHLDYDSLDEDDYGTRRSGPPGSAAITGRGFHRILLERPRRRWSLAPIRIKAFNWSVQSLTIMYPAHLGLKMQALSGLLLVCLFLHAADVFARMVLLMQAS
ncbi:hypothetical protein POTOM_009897 [Populus tomentosa]|uniref:Uncharacterized protein n=1 Tax=Populus tomentosa TaxID=118781 RepID=A0A8X8AC86_POPTO|nr:hypothetical protein POTOM_009897 [Populus tomentosa]